MTLPVRTLLVFAFAPAVAAAASGGAPVLVPHSGYLLGASDEALTAPSLSFAFRVYDASTGGAAQWSDAACAGSVSNGYFALVLGTGDCAGDGLDTADLPPGASRWLEIEVAGVLLAPRQLLSSVPAAALAGDAQRLGGALPSAYATKAELAVPAGAINTTGLVHWSQLTGVPGGLADGTDDGDTYTADESTITLAGGQFGVRAGGVGALQLASDAASLAKVSGGVLVSLGGQIGVGTASPSERLDVAGNIRASGTITGTTLSGNHTGSGAALTGVNAAQVGGRTLGDLQGMFAPIGGNAATATCDLSHRGYIYFDTGLNQFRGCDGAGNWISLTGGGSAASSTLGTQANPGKSCLDILNQRPGVVSGTYWVNPAGTGAFATWCEMTLSGGGWSLAAVVAQGDGAGQNWSHASGHWESTTTFGALGTSSAPLEDFKSAAFSNLKGKSILVTYKNQLLLRTDEGCLQGQTLRARLAAYAWEGTAGEPWGTGTPRAHGCLLAQTSAIAGEKALLNGTSQSRLLLKFGEANGVQEANKDRAYFSTPARVNVDNPRGLGAFNAGACSPPNCENDVGGFNADGTNNDAATPGTAGDAYAIYVREAFGTTCKTLKDADPLLQTGLYTIDPDGPAGNAPFAAWCDMSTADGGWTLVVRDNWDSQEVAKGQITLPAANSVGSPDGTGDYVGPWNLVGTYLYRCKSCPGDNAFLSRQTLPIGSSDATMASGSYDQPLLTLGGAVVMAGNTATSRLNFLTQNGTAACGSTSAARDNGSNCWGNFFGTSYWEMLPNGNSTATNAAGHVNELYVR